MATSVAPESVEADETKKGCSLSRIIPHAASKRIREVAMEYLGTLILGTMITFCTGYYLTSGPLVLGTLLMVLTFVGGHISGAHFNPAVTLAVFLKSLIDRKKGAKAFKWYHLLIYWTCQFGAGFTAPFIGVFQNGGEYFAPTDMLAEDFNQTAWDAIDYSSGPAVARAEIRGQQAPVLVIFALEIIFSMMFINVFLGTLATEASGARKNSHFGISIGFAYLASIVAIGPVTGSCLNPAFSYLGFMNKQKIPAEMWIHVVAPFLGALAAVIYSKAIDLPIKCFKEKEMNDTKTNQGYGAQKKDSSPLWQKALNEYQGTFYLCFTVMMCVTYSESTANTGLAIGSMLMVQVYRGGYISGGHYNPAVTCAVFIENVLRRNQEGTPALVFYTYAVLQAVIYIVVQISAAIVVGVIGLAWFRKEGMGFPQPENGAQDAEVYAQSLLWESWYTFLLCFTVLTVALGSVRGNQYYGIAIGFVVFVGASTVGNISGACFNPAVGALAVMAGEGQMNLYVFVPLVASVTAGFFFLFVEPSDTEAEEDAARKAKAAAAIEDDEEMTVDDIQDSADI